MPEVAITRPDPSDTARNFNPSLYRRAYEQRRTVSQMLEADDPSHTYAAEENPLGLDAFERVLRADQIIVRDMPDSGIRATTWEEMHSSDQRKAMLPELMSRYYRRAARLTPQQKHLLTTIDEATLTPQKRAVLLGGDAAVGGLVNPWYDAPEIRAPRLVPPIPLDAIVARVTALDTDAYRTLYIVDDLSTDAYRMKRVGEGDEIPATSLVTGEHTIRIQKYGRAIRATYEQLRRQRIDRIAFLIARMAVMAEKDKVVDALKTVVNGDGNANTSATVIAMRSGSYPTGALDPAATVGTLTLKAWQTFKLRFSLTYAPDVVIGTETTLTQLLNLPVGQGAGVIPLGLMPANAFGVVGPINDYLAGGVRYGLLSSSDITDLQLIAFQSDMTLEMVTEIGGNVSEVERYINNQTQLLTLTEVVGWGVIDPNSSKILNINA
jgi:hypothetical protein